MICSSCGFVKIVAQVICGISINFASRLCAGHDDREEDNAETVGGVLTRKVTARSEDRVQGEVRLQEARPWWRTRHCTNCCFVTTCVARKAPECGSPNSNGCCRRRSG